VLWECGGAPPPLKSVPKSKIVVFRCDLITLTHETREMTRKEEIIELIYKDDTYAIVDLYL
jgi:hypothetical protein